MLREDWVELRCLAILVQTCGADASIAGRLEDRHASHTQDADQIADPDRILLRDCLLIVSIRIGDDLWQLVVGLREQELVVGQVWLVLVRGTSGLDWIWDIRAARTHVSCVHTPTSFGYSRATSSDVFCYRERVGDGNNVLRVQIGLAIVIIGRRLWQIRRAIFGVDKDD